MISKINCFLNWSGKHLYEDPRTMTWSSDFPKAAISRTINVSIRNLAKEGEERIGLKLRKIGPTFE